ncbi:hypothetical protein SAMN05216338_1001147 [Bradyrhizobium sp. Rc2d]|nr:hypothetical protein SAMN05216338_1001147 [Bradyrhizobium sp. Rc2d]
MTHTRKQVTLLVLSATSEIGRIHGSQSVADRYQQHYGPIGNYALNSFDATRMLLSAIEWSAGEWRSFLVQAADDLCVGHNDRISSGSECRTFSI